MLKCPKVSQLDKVVVSRLIGLDGEKHCVQSGVEPLFLISLSLI